MNFGSESKICSPQEILWQFEDIPHSYSDSVLKSFSFFSFGLNATPSFLIFGSCAWPYSSVEYRLLFQDWSLVIPSSFTKEIAILTNSALYILIESVFCFLYLDLSLNISFKLSYMCDDIKRKVYHKLVLKKLTCYVFTTIRWTSYWTSLVYTNFYSIRTIPKNVQQRLLYLKHNSL